jgi:hypothetical protein
VRSTAGLWWVRVAVRRRSCWWGRSGRRTCRRACRSGLRRRQVTAQVIPAGDAVSRPGAGELAGPESRGDWTRAGAEPLEAKGVKIGAVKGSSQKDSEARDAKVKQSERDAAVAPPIEDVAPSAGPDSGTEDDERERRSEAAKKAARTRKRNERKAAREEADRVAEEQKRQRQASPAARC